jgi:hypothetical protein
MNAFYIPKAAWPQATEIIDSMTNKVEVWHDGSFCRQSGAALTWPLERHGHEGRETPALVLAARDGGWINVDGQYEDAFRLVLVPATSGWTGTEYPLPSQWAEALRVLPHRS